MRKIDLQNALKHYDEKKRSLGRRYDPHNVFVLRRILNDPEVEHLKPEDRILRNQFKESYRPREAGGLTVFSSPKGCQC